MKRLVLVFLTFFLITYSFGQTTIIGIWKPIKVSYYNHFTKTLNIIYEIGKTDSIKKELLHRYLNQDTTDSEYVRDDTLEFKNKLEKDFTNYQFARLEFKKDNKFFVESYGLIIPTAEPGWHYGDKQVGKWIKSKVLKLTIGSKKNNQKFIYKIKELTKEKLILEQTFENYCEIYNEIILVRQ